MNVLLAIPSRNQNQYLAEQIEAVKNQTVLPCRVLYMADRPTGRERVEAMRTIGTDPIIEYYPVTTRPDYVGRPQMTAGEEWFLAGHVRNEAVKYMDSHPEIDAVVFIDGDCIPEPDLIKSHAEVLANNDKPCVTVGKRKEAQFGWDDQRTDDRNFLDMFRDTPNEIDNETWFVDSGVVWTCNFGMNRNALSALKHLNKKLYGREEAFSSDFLGTWGGEDGFIGMECFYTGIPVVALENGDNGIRHIYHMRTSGKYNHVAFLDYLDDKRRELMYLLDLYKLNVRGLEYVDRETMLADFCRAEPRADKL